MSAGDGDGGAALFSVPVSSVLPEKDSVFVEFGRVPSTLDVGGAGDALSQTAAWSVLSIVAINLVGFGRRIVVVVGCCCEFGGVSKCIFDGFVVG